MGRSRGGFSTKIDEYLIGLGIVPVIPSKENKDRSARPVEFAKPTYRRRSLVGNLIGWLKPSIFGSMKKSGIMP